MPGAPSSVLSPMQKSLARQECLVCRPSSRFMFLYLFMFFCRLRRTPGIVWAKAEESTFCLGLPLSLFCLARFEEVHNAAYLQKHY